MNIKSRSLFHIKNNTWTMKCGTKIKLFNMSDNHIKNCINLLNRNEIIKDVYSNDIKLFKKELRIRLRSNLNKIDLVNL